MKYPILYKRGTTNFDNNGLGVLHDAYDIAIKEVLNGVFTLDMKYPYTSNLGNVISRGDIIGVDASNRLKNQKFRILSVTQENNLTLTIHAFHKTFDTTTDYVRGPLDIKHQSCEYVLNMLFNKSYKSKNYVGYSDIVNKQDFKCANKPLASAIIGSEGSIIDTFGNGAQIERDNSVVDKISVLQRRGYDTNILISYGKNMTGYKCIEDEQALCTVLIPYAIDSQTQQKIVGDDILAPNYNEFNGDLYIVEYDVSGRIQQGLDITKNLINKLGAEYMEESKCYIPKLTYIIDFVKLAEHGYPNDYNLDKLQNIGIGDTVIVYHRQYNVRTQARVTEIVYDPISASYQKIVLGDVRATYGSIGSNNNGPLQGPPGPQGPPGVDGNIGDFPDELPPVPKLEGTTRGMSTVTLTWSYANKVYYEYEVYASQRADFTPTAFDLLYRGKASSYTYNVNPNETWYYYARAINSHGRSTALSNKVTITTHKIPDGYTYFEKGAIGDALIDTLNLGRGWVGKLTADHLEVKGFFDVLDSNGKSTFNIDSYGRIYANFTSMQLNSEDVSTIPYVDAVKTEVATEIKGFEEKITPAALKRVFSTDFYTKDNADSQFTSKTEFEQNNREVLIKIEQTGKPQLVPNGALNEGTKFWGAWQAQRTVELFGGYKWFTITPQFELGTQSFGVLMPELEVQAGKTYTVGAWVSGDVQSLNYNYLMQLKDASMVGVQRIDSISIGNVSKQAKRVSITFTSLVTGFVQIMFGYEGVMSAKLKLRIAEACCFEGHFLHPYQEAHNTVYNSNAYFDITGMGMKHKDGSISRITHDSFQLTDVYERLKMAMKKGTLYAYDVENGNLLGMFGSNRLNTKYKGVTTGIAGSSHYYAIGVSYELTDTSDLTMKPYMLIAQQDLKNVFGQSHMSAGVHFMNTPTIFHEPVHCKRYFAGTGVYSPNSILSLGYTDITSNYQTAFAVDGGVQRLKGYLPLDMQGWQIYNASLAYSVVNRNIRMGIKPLKETEVASRSVFDEIEIVNRLTRTSLKGDSIGELDVTNVTNKDEIMVDENNADLSKLVTILFKEVKELKAEIKALKERN